MRRACELKSRRVDSAAANVASRRRVLNIRTQYAAANAAYTTTSSTANATVTADANEGNARNGPPRGAVLGAFRELLRAQQRAFAGDVRTIDTFRLETHRRFSAAPEAAATYKTNEKKKFVDPLQEAREVILFLDKQIVQGVSTQAHRTSTPVADEERKRGENGSGLKAEDGGKQTFRLRFRDTSARIKHWPPPGFDEQGRRIPDTPTVPSKRSKRNSDGREEEPVSGCCGGGNA